MTRKSHSNLDTPLDPFYFDPQYLYPHSSLRPAFEPLPANHQWNRQRLPTLFVMSDASVNLSNESPTHSPVGNFPPLHEDINGPVSPRSVLSIIHGNEHIGNAALRKLVEGLCATIDVRAQQNRAQVSTLQNRIVDLEDRVGILQGDEDACPKGYVENKGYVKNFD